MTVAAIALAVAGVVAALSLVGQQLRAGAGRPTIGTAPPKGSARAGVLYAFTLAFAPSAKESASRHLPTYAAGVAYHLAIFTMLAGLLASLVSVGLPAAAAYAAATLLGVGLLSGLALQVKRIVRTDLRRISVPDDFIANLLVDAGLACGLAAVLAPSFVPAFQFAGAVLLLYAPLGKLRHMASLLGSRWSLGAQLGRRGVRPARTGGVGRG